MIEHEVVEMLAALAQETRLKIFRKLVNVGANGVAAGTIAEDLSVPASSLSFHLNQLKAAGLIKCRRESRSLIYSVSMESYAKLLQFLTEECCAGHPEVCLPNGLLPQPCNA
jgi:DNA-binding transcriptional ArsR family regulator